MCRIQVSIMADNYIYCFHARNHRTSDACKMPISLRNFVRTGNYRMAAYSAGERVFKLRPNFAESCVPCSHCILYVCRLTKECTEEDLYNLFSAYGRICEIRLMVDREGYCRGFAFVRFENATTVCTIIDKCNGRNMYNVDGSNRFPIRVSHSLGAKLLVTGIPLDNSEELLEQIFKECLRGVTNVIVPENARDESLNRGYIFLTFNSFENAVVAREKIWYNKTAIWNPVCLAEWATPKMPSLTTNTVKEI